MKPQHPVLQIAISRLQEFVRRPEAVFWVYFFPVLMVIVLGIAFRNQPVETFAVDIVENSMADPLIEKLGQHPQLQLNKATAEEALNRLRTGKTTLVVSAESGINNLEYQFDPARPGSMSARNLFDDAIQRKLGRADVVESKDVIFSEPGGSYVDFLVPGLLGMGLMGGGMWGVGFAIVDMRIRKLLKRFMATPMQRSHFLMGMMISRLVFMIPQIFFLLLFSYLCFGVAVYGNWIALTVIVLLGAVEFAAIGLLVAARARTLETASGLMNLVMLPMWTLSGLFFSYERFPELFQPAIRCLPLTPLIDALRAIMMDGKPITTLGFEIVVIVVWTVVSFGVALATFRWND
ncbi:MAG: ABC transporter permease [Planctomycetota bacterium]